MSEIKNGFIKGERRMFSGIVTRAEERDTKHGPLRIVAVDTDEGDVIKMFSNSDFAKSARVGARVKFSAKVKFRDVYKKSESIMVTFPVEEE